MPREALVAFLTALATDRALCERWMRCGTRDARMSLLDDEAGRFGLDEGDKNALASADFNTVQRIAGNQQHSGSGTRAAIRIEIDLPK